MGMTSGMRDFPHPWVPFLLVLVVALEVSNAGNNLHHHRQWQHYRLGDVVNGIIHETTYKSWNDTLKFYNRKWPKSIGTAYMHRATVANDYDTLCRIANEHLVAEWEKENVKNELLVPETGEVVVHLRLGDVTTAEKAGTRELWVEGYEPFVKNQSYYEGVAKRIPPGARTVVIVGWGHHVASNAYGTDDASSAYRQQVVAWFESKGYVVKYRWERPPDEDFVFMSNADVFIFGGGGFSHAVGECVRRKLRSRWLERKGVTGGGITLGKPACDPASHDVLCNAWADQPL